MRPAPYTPLRAGVAADGQIVHAAGAEKFPGRKNFQKELSQSGDYESAEHESEHSGHRDEGGAIHDRLQR